MTHPGQSLPVQMKQIPQENRQNMMKPPAIIPLNTIPPGLQQILMGNQLGQQRIGPSPLLVSQNPLSTQSLPANFRIGGGQEFPIQYSLATSSLPARLGNPPPFLTATPAFQQQVLRTSSPEDDDDDSLTEGDPRHKRRREMNRIAQQKSRMKKDQKISDLQKDNDDLKAKIISLDAEVKVWKNMTKKSENEGNDVKRRLAEITEKYEKARRQLKEKIDFDISQISIPVPNLALERPTSTQKIEEMEDESSDRLQIDDNSDERLTDFQPKAEIIEPETSTKLIVESSSNPNTDMMQKEIQTLQEELNRMYTLTNQQSEANKLLHQALVDQQARFALKEAKIEDNAQLELSQIQQVTVSPVKKINRVGSRWVKRYSGKGITKRDIEKVFNSNITKLTTAKQWQRKAIE